MPDDDNLLMKAKVLAVAASYKFEKDPKGAFQDLLGSVHALIDLIADMWGEDTETEDEELAEDEELDEEPME